MSTLVVGYGEVGRALHKVLKHAWILDLDPRVSTWEGQAIDIAHICIPYGKTFKQTIKEFKKKVPLVIVHSSVPVGTCDKLGVAHSPIRGVHPHLAKGIRTFVKYFGGRKARRAAQIFEKLGIKTRVYPNAKTTEALKLWETTQYGRLIMLEKEIHAWCSKNKVDFNAVYTTANRDYNVGYIKLGRPEVVRPYLKHMPGKIGGHCVTPNAKLLKIKL